MSDNGDSFLNRLHHLFFKAPKTKNQVFEYLNQAYEHRLLSSDALRMIQGVLQVSEMHVRDVMVPRAQMVVVEHDMTPQTAMPVIIQSAHSRFPVIAQDRNEVLGIVLAKDLLPYCVHPLSKTPFIRELVRPAVFIPESKRLDILLKEFRLNHHHMAIVVDEFGGVSGLVTIEDVLEQIVGSIVDEHDVENDENNIKKVKDNEYWVKALTPLDQFDTYFHSTLDNGEFDTIGGLVMQQFGYLPKRNESIDIGLFSITVLKATNRRLVLLKIVCHENNKQDENK